MKTKFYFFLCVICCLSSIGYLYFFAEDRFTSKSQFSIIVQDRSSADVSAGLLSLISTSGASVSPDMQATIGFIHSADLLLQLEKDFDLVKHFQSPKDDIVFKLEEEASLEDRLSYYRKIIKARYNATSGLIDLEVETYDPDLSYKLSKKILSDTEQFINSLNKDVANERLDFVRLELKRAQKGVEKCERKMLEFQTKHKLIQPETIIAARQEAIQSLSLEKINKEIKLSTLRSRSPRSPIIGELKTAIINISEEIKSQEAVLAGPEQEKLNAILASFKSLQLEYVFATKLREGAEILLEQTRAEAIVKSRFFSVIQKPYKSEECTSPRRGYLSFTSVMIIVLLFYLLRAFWLSIFDRV